jgi:class 3 adenylate cyclase/tetratricopeptide (TPR) repeat protein
MPSECAACGFANRPGALFCGSCGAQLGRSCPECGEVVAPGLAYCTACGTELAAPEPAVSMREERKVVTVLFADIVGSTSRAERHDPEDVRRLLDSFHTRLKAEIERYGGTVEKYIGDAVMALFGAPRAHEDDPERALRAALGIREAIGELNAADPSLGLQVRVGVTTGEAAVRVGARPERGESMAAGDVVNTGARLQAAASVGGILVDEPTYRSARSVIDFRASAPVEARGKSEPVVVWEALGARTRLGVDIAFRGGADIVGREAELHLLREALARAQRERTPQLVTVVGIPGIGKSRLLFELYSVLHADPSLLITWRQGRSLPYGEGVSFWALGEIVKAQAGILESDPAEDAAGKLRLQVETFLPEATEADWVLEHLRPLVGLGADPATGRREEAFAAWRRFFESMAEQRPLVLVFEDAHWADDDLLDFVDHLVDWTMGVPLLVLCTARPELLERRTGWGGGKRSAVTVSLSPLSEGETDRLVSALLDRRLLPESRRRALLARAGGNPLYAEEYARMLAQQANGDELPLPDSVQGIIAARLDTLSEEEKTAVQEAAVVGKVFWVGSLALLGARDRDEAEDLLLALERKEFVRRERRSSVAGETAYVFRHVLVRDVAYAQIPRPRRAQLHRLAAEWIASVAADRPEDLADLVAHHYRSALQFARASRQDVGDLAEHARLALREAGDRAASLNAFPAAARLYEAALELWPNDDPERPYLLYRYGVALHYGGGAAEALQDAAAELLDAGEREHAAEAYTVLAEAFWLQGRRAEAIEHLEGATALLADARPSRAKVLVLANLARFRMAADEAEEAVRVGFAALTMADELGLPELSASALNTLGVTRVGMGDRGGLVDLERAVALSERLNSAEVVRAYNNLASTLTALGELDRAHRLYGQARGAAKRFGLVGPLRWLEVEEMDEQFTRGRWDDALAVAERALEEAGTFVPHLREVDAYVIRAAVRLARGDAAGALGDSAAAVDFARGPQDPQILFPALACRARVLVETDHEDEARVQVDELLDRWRASPASLVTRWVADLAPVAVAVGQADALAETTRGALLSTGWLEAAIAFAAGDPQRAAGLYAEIGSLPDEAWARLCAAQTLASAGRRGEAEGQLHLALDFFRRVGAAAYVAEGESLLAST